MTREEAIKLLPPARWYGGDAAGGYVIDVLITLNLIKFDEPVKGAYSSVTMCGLSISQVRALQHIFIQKVGIAPDLLDATEIVRKFEKACK